MNKKILKEHIIPIYLACIIYIIIPFSPLNILLVISPLLIISLSIYLKDRYIGIIGIFLFYLITLPQVTIPSMSSIIQISIFLLLILIPSLLLVNQILLNQSINKMFLTYLNKKKSIFKVIFFSLLIFVLFYIVTLFLKIPVFLSIEFVQGQILLLSGISLIILLSILLKPVYIE